jgi:hypothetical protein
MLNEGGRYQQQAAEDELDIESSAKPVIGGAGESFLFRL